MANGRCRMHGGPSPGAPKGNRNAFKHSRYGAKALDQFLDNMADIDDMVDELNDAAKKADRDDYHAKALRQARAYKLTQIVLTAALHQHRLIEEQRAASSRLPKLARHLARCQSDA
jgi:hypothetical protein